MAMHWATACTVLNRRIYHVYISSLLCKFHSTAQCRYKHQHQLKMCQQASVTPNTAFFPAFRRVQYNSWLCPWTVSDTRGQIGYSVQRIKGFIFQKNAFAWSTLCRHEQVWWQNKNLKIPTITRANRTHYTLLTMLYFREILSVMNLDYDRRSSDWAIVLWCSALSCGLQLKYVALRWTRGISLKGRNTQESTLAVARLERDDLIYT